MKRACLVLAVLALTGCLPKIASHKFTPLAASTGQRLWQMTYRGYSPEEANKVIGEEVAKNKLCPGGWEIISERKDGEDTIIEGRCRN